MSVPIPLLLLTPVWAQMLAPLTLVSRRNLSRPVLWVAVAAVVSVAGDFLGRLVAAHVGNNQWLISIVEPLMFTLYLAGLSEWQVTRAERKTFRTAIFALLIAYVLLTALFEDVSTFSRFGGPLYALSLLAAGSWTMARRAAVTIWPSILRTDWFWVAGGLALYGATTLVSGQVGALLLADHRLDLFVSVWDVRAVCTDLVFVAVAAGCCIRPLGLEPDR